MNTKLDIPITGHMHIYLVYVYSHVPCVHRHILWSRLWPKSDQVLFIMLLSQSGNMAISDMRTRTDRLKHTGGGGDVTHVAVVCRVLE